MPGYLWRPALFFLDWARVFPKIGDLNRRSLNITVNFDSYIRMQNEKSRISYCINNRLWDLATCLIVDASWFRSISKWFSGPTTVSSASDLVWSDLGGCSSSGAWGGRAWLRPDGPGWFGSNGTSSVRVLTSCSSREDGFGVEVTEGVKGTEKRFYLNVFKTLF